MRKLRGSMRSDSGGRRRRGKKLERRNESEKTWALRNMVSAREHGACVSRVLTLSTADYTDPCALGAIASDSAASEDAERYPERQYFILSSAGKPVYVSSLTSARLARSASFLEARKARAEASGDAAPDEEERERLDEERRAELRAADDLDDEAATMRVAVMQALVSNYAGKGDNKLVEESRTVLELAPRAQITYLLKPPLYLVCISEWGEAESIRRAHLEHLYLAVLSLVSGSQLSKLFARAANFDLRRLLEGTDGLLDALVKRLQVDPAVPLVALQPLRLDPALREDVGSLLLPPKGDKRPKDLLYVLLLARQRIVTLVRPRKHSVHPADCQLLVNTVYGTKALKESGTESWVPICLPKFAPQGFVHAHVSFLDADEKLVRDAKQDEEEGEEGKQKGKHQPDLALVLVTGNRDGFEELSAWRNEILQVSAPFLMHRTAQRSHFLLHTHRRFNRQGNCSVFSLRSRAPPSPPTNSASRACGTLCSSGAPTSSSRRRASRSRTSPARRRTEGC